MKEKYAPLFEPIGLKHGGRLENRFAMCPMVVFAADPATGQPTEEVIKYFERRSKFADLLITGAITVQENIQGHPKQLSIFNDEAFDTYSKLAAAMKSNGSKAIGQIQHPGREGAYGCYVTGKAYAPSAIEFPFLQYKVTELTEDEVWQVVKDFGLAAQRLLKAGFDGVEIHGANHYLIQQFFSSYSNQRTDYWGGSFEKRMNFAIEVTKEVLKVARAENPEAIVGYRISPEEIHGEMVGYDLDDSLKLIDKLLEQYLDFLDLSSAAGGNFGKDAYKAMPQRGDFTEPVSLVIKKFVAGRVPVVISGTIRSADEALDALNYGDVVSMGVAALSDPDFKEKILADKEETIHMNVKGHTEDLELPSGLIEVYTAGIGLPQVEGLIEKE